MMLTEMRSPMCSVRYHSASYSDCRLSELLSFVLIEPKLWLYDMVWLSWFSRAESIRLTL